MRKQALILILLLTSLVSLSATSLDGVRKAFVEASAASYAPSDELTERFIEYSSYGSANDVLLMQLYNNVHLPESEVGRLMEGFDWEEGNWKDLDYSAMDRGSWPSTRHVTRMYSLAKLYVSEGSKWHKSEKMGKLLHSSMGWWFRNMPVCPNWWHNDIGVPKKMTAVLIMLRDELSEAEIEGGLNVLKAAQFGGTGQNKVWLAGNNLMKGLLIDDPALVKQARDYIAEEIFITEEEGIQRDWSFHQHGPMIQFGNYGLTYVDVLSFWIRVLKGSEFAFSEEQTSIVSNLLKEGISLSIWKGVMDPSFCGRQNFINGGPGKAFALAVAAKNMEAASEGKNAAFFAKVAAENLQPELYDNSIVGGRYFWRSDCGIWRRPQWYSSIRMHSERTIGFEFTNRENTLANFSADGALILMQDGREFDNIFAYWDWRKVPGVTSYDDGKPIKSDDSRKAKQNNSEHVGGLVGADAMVATMELERDGLHAFKSAFFFDDCVVNLGADITANNDQFKSVTTSVDQIHHMGKVRHGSNWVHHSDRGYVSLDGTPMQVSQDVQKGKWDDIDPVFRNKWDEGKVFKVWFEHPLADLKSSEAGTYAYAMLPCRSASQTAAIAKNVAKGSSDAIVRVIRNDKACQAVSHGDILSAVFHTAGSFDLDGRTFEISEPSIMIVEGAESRTEVLPAP